MNVMLSYNELGNTQISGMQLCKCIIINNIWSCLHCYDWRRY